MKSLIFFLIFCMAIIACEQQLFNSLPPETQDGRGTFGCEIDGEIWQPSVDLAFDQRGRANVENDTSLTLNATGDGDQIQMWITGEIKEDNFILNSSNRPMGKYRSGQLKKNFFTSESHTGELLITKYDTINQIISGTFWFDAVNEDGEVAKIREGRFDLTYNSN